MTYMIGKGLPSPFSVVKKVVDAGQDVVNVVTGGGKPAAKAEPALPTLSETQPLLLGKRDDPLGKLTNPEFYVFNAFVILQIKGKAINEEEKKVYRWLSYKRVGRGNEVSEVKLDEFLKVYNGDVVDRARVSLGLEPIAVVVRANKESVAAAARAAAAERAAAEQAQAWAQAATDAAAAQAEAERVAAELALAQRQLIQIQQQPPLPEGMSTTTKIAIGVGVAAVVGGSIYLATRKR